MAAEKRDKEEEEVKTDDGSPKIKPRPIVRLGIFLISHSPIFSVLFSAAGVLALLILPLLAKNTYISENALMPGSARSMLSHRDVSDGSKLVKDIQNFRLNHEGQGVGVQKIIGKYMSDMGAEVYYQKFHPEGNQFHPLHFFSGPDSYTSLGNVSCASYGINVAGIIRAPRGDGKESIVLVTPFDSINGEDYDALSLGIASSLFSLLARVTWLSKDIIWLVSDSRYGDYRAVSAWLSEYHTPSFKVSVSDLLKCDELNTADNFKRAGTMAAALVLKVDGRSERFEDTLSIYAEASNGQMPNLDLINVVNYLAVHRQGFYVRVEKVVSLLSSSYPKIVGEVFEAVGKVARTLNPTWNFGIPAAEYLEGSATLASSLYSQALGIPTGPHGAFRDYQVDAITLKVSPRFPPDSKARQHDFFLRGAGLLEGTIRSVNNLLEKFHQSFFLYLLTSPSKFISVGVYMIAFALLVAPLPMVAASLYVDGCKALTTSTQAENLKSWKWLDAAKQVFALHLVGLIVTLLPYFICQVPSEHSPTNRAILWATASSSLLLITFVTIPDCSPFSSRRLHGANWSVLKSVTISAAFIGLCLMSIINFATAEIGALLLVPMCLMTRPIIPDLRSRRLKSLLRALCSIVLVTIGFPVMFFAISKGLIGEGLVGLSLGGEFWTWLESLWAWKSATYLYIGMIHLPCWLLCFCILFHPA